MPKIYAGEISRLNIDELEKIVQKIIIINYAKGDAKIAAKKIVRLFYAPENSLKISKK